MLVVFHLLHNQEKNSGVLKGKFGSSEKLNSGIGELVADVFVEMISLILDSECGLL